MSTPDQPTQSDNGTYPEDGPQEVEQSPDLDYSIPAPPVTDVVS